MNIKTEQGETGGAFIYTGDNGNKAKMTFSKAGDSMIIIFRLKPKHHYL